MRVRPTIESNGSLKVIYKNKLVILPQGTWTINDVILQNGTNEIYFNSFDIHNLTWDDLAMNEVTWGDFKKKRLFEWYKSNGDETMVIKKWSDFTDSTWTNLSTETWSDQMYMSSITKDIKNVYIKYERGDL